VKIRLANSAALGIRGKSTDPLTEIPVELHPANWRLFHPDGRPYLPEELPLSRAVLKGEVTQDEEVIIRRSDGESRWVLASGAPVRNAKGDIVAGVVVFPDITDRKKAEVELRESEERFRRVFEDGPMGMAMLNDTFRFMRVNPAFASMLGYTAEELLRLSVAEITHPDDLTKNMEQVRRLMRDDIPIYQTEKRYLSKTGQVVWGLLHVSALHDKNGRFRCFLAIIGNISERKRNEVALLKSEEELRTSLDEKVALLREVHHRVKNNLQIISSLINLEARRMPSPEVLSFLNDTQSRIRAMALLHEALYGSENLARVNVPRYVDGLCAHIARSYNSANRRIKLCLEVEDVGLPMERIIPLGLIINELVSNAYKYAFANRTDGEVTVRLHVEEERCILTVMDNGVGLPPDYDPGKATTLGLRLVLNLTRQLDGHFAIHRDSGARFEIDFQRVTAGPSLAHDV
jgi:PAS domain S-box-containing protein